MMSSGGKKRSRAICIRAYQLSMDGYTHRQIADLILCEPEQIAGKVQRGRQAMIHDERESVEREQESNYNRDIQQGIDRASRR